MEPKYTPDDLRYFERSKITDVKVKVRMFQERAIIRAIVTEAFTKGYAVRVWDGEDWATDGFLKSELDTVMDAIMATDEENIFFHRDRVESDPPPRRGTVYSEFIKLGQIFLVYGNDGNDVMADSTVNDQMDELNASVSDLSDYLGMRWGVGFPDYCCLLRDEATGATWMTLTGVAKDITRFDTYEAAKEYLEKHFAGQFHDENRFNPVTGKMELTL